LGSGQGNIINSSNQSFDALQLLGLESADIDIALDDLTGVEFAQFINEYLEHINIETRTIAVIQAISSNVLIIRIVSVYFKANPLQSKHLETANIRILGFEIDCVNLRSESYTGKL
jgi:two-component SAPR family response regulator